MRRLSALLCFLLLATPRALAAGERLGREAGDRPKLGRDLQHKRGDEQVDVIVQYRTAPAQRHLDRARGARAALRQDLPLVNAAAYRVRAKDLDALAADPDVLHVSPDYPVSAELNYARPTTGADIAYQSNSTGYGIGVAVIDSGITVREDLQFRLSYSEDLGTGDGTTSDLYGHGTHVAGVIAGGGYSDSRVVGIARKVKLINLKVLDRDGKPRTWNYQRIADQEAEHAEAAQAELTKAGETVYPLGQVVARQGQGEQVVIR